jgi:hypothetical protein
VGAYAPQAHVVAVQGHARQARAALCWTFSVLECIGEVAYRLRLPADARAHDVLHVGVLNPFRGEPPSTTPPLPPLLHGRVLPVPERVLCASLCRGVWHVLVRWEGLSRAEATWEPVDAFRKENPSF